MPVRFGGRARFKTPIYALKLKISVCWRSAMNADRPARTDTENREKRNDWYIGVKALDNEPSKACRSDVEICT